MTSAAWQHVMVAVAVDAWCICARRRADPDIDIDASADSDAGADIADTACSCGGLTQSAADVHHDIARALERDTVVEARCPRCTSSLGPVSPGAAAPPGRWQRASPSGRRLRCTSCTTGAGPHRDAEPFLEVHPPSAAERLAIPGLRAIVVGPAQALLDVDPASFIAATGTLVLTAERLAGAVHSDDVDVRRRVLRHRAVTPALLALLAHDVDAGLRAAVARHERAPAAALLQLSGDADASIRAAVASHAHPPLPALERLATDVDDDVRLRVSRHPHTTAALLTTLLSTATPRLRAAIAAHGATPRPLLLQLLEGGEKPVLQALAGRARGDDELTRLLKKRGYSLKQEPPPPFDCGDDPNSHRH